MSSAPALPLRVAAAGVCCAVGFSTAATRAAIRARLDHFRETDFVDDANQPLRGALLHDIPLWGYRRLQFMARSALAECLAQLDIPADLPLPPLIALGSAWQRGERYPTLLGQLVEGLRPAEGHSPGTTMTHTGKAGIGSAINEARRLLGGPTPPSHVIVLGVDSLFEADTIEALVRAQRIRCSTNADGFLPGEAAAAVALTSSAHDGPALWIDGVSLEHEASGPLDDTPLVARGLTRALRAALSEADCDASDIDFHASAISGEQWYFKEAALAIDRILEARRPSFAHRLVAQSVGEIGAAFGPLMLAWLADEMGRSDGPGRGALMHLANDDGTRCALTLRYHHRTTEDG